MQKAARDSVCSPSSPLFAALAAYAPLRGPCPCVPRRTGPLLSGPSLHAHSLHNNSISADGAKAVANALPRCVALTRLYLGGYFDSDNIGPDGAEAVAAVLPLTKSLQLLECVSLGLLARPPRDRPTPPPPPHPPPFHPPPRATRATARHARHRATRATALKLALLCSCTVFVTTIWATWEQKRLRMHCRCAPHSTNSSTVPTLVPPPAPSQR